MELFKEKEKKIKLKNYFILFAICVATFLIFLYILSWYKQYNDTKLSIPVISEVLSTVEYKELDNVLRERDFLILYTCTTSESKCRSFESKFKKYVIEEDLADNIMYFNLGQYKEENNILNKMYLKYKADKLLKKLNDYPSLLIFNQGKIVDILSPSENENVSIASVKNFLRNYEEFL